MKQKHEKNDKSTGQQAESSHQESGAVKPPSSRCMIEMKSPKMSAEPDPRELSVKMEQFAHLLNLKLQAESWNGVMGCVKDRNWLRAIQRDDGTLGLPVNMADLLFQSGETFMEHILSVLFEEASTGRHTQQSLDQAMEHCEKLIPNSRGWVDARTLHSFLEEDRDFPGWCEYLAFASKEYFPRGGRHTSIDAASEDFNIRGTKRVPRPFKVNAHFAFKIALASQTRRGSLLRDVYLTFERVARLPNKIWTGQLLARNPFEQP